MSLTQGQRRAAGRTSDPLVLPTHNDEPPPTPPPGFTLTGTARKLWRETWSTGASTVWGDDDFVAVAVYVLAAARYADHEDERTSALATEIRRHQKALGLSPEGRKALGMFTPQEAAATAPRASVSPLRAAQ